MTLGRGGASRPFPKFSSIRPGPMPSRIVTYTHRLKRAPRKRKAQAAAIAGPTIVTAAGKHDRDRRCEADAGHEASPEIKAFFARMMRPPGA